MEHLPVQQPLPLAFVNGEAVVEQPHDLYIPPDALEVILESFEGPLDLLLYLIRKEKMDIMTMPVADITRQYMDYVEVMKTLKLELAGEYLLMAAILAEIKSRLLLPKRDNDINEEEDPRAELIRRLQEYEKVQAAASELDNKPRLERDLFGTNVKVAKMPVAENQQPDVALKELIVAFSVAMKRAGAYEHHQITAEKLSTRERMSAILAKLKQLPKGEFLRFSSLFSVEEGKAGCVVSFLATLELLKEHLIVLVQGGPKTQMHIALSHEA